VPFDRARSRRGFGYAQVLVTKPRGQSLAFILFRYRGSATVMLF
jgi:hypothetical protein